MATSLTPARSRTPPTLCGKILYVSFTSKDLLLTRDSFSNNEFDSPAQYVPYDGLNGPTDGHEWLASHPFY